MEINVFAAAFFALGIALMFLGLDLVISSRRVVLDNRIGSYASLPPEPPDQTSTSGTDRSNKTAGRNWKRRIAVELARADLPITPSEYLLATLLFALLGWLVGLMILHNPVLGLVGLVVGIISPWLYVSYLQHKRLEAFDGELEGALTMLANTLRSGSGLVQAMESVAKEFAPPLSTEFGRVVREVSLGVGLSEALDNLVRRNPSLDLEMVVTAINVNHEVGGNLAEVLDRISQTIRERVRMASEVRALTAQQRLSAIVLVFLPIAVSFVVYMMNPNYMALLWQNTCGLIMLGVGLFLLSIGILMIRRILVLKY